MCISMHQPEVIELLRKQGISAPTDHPMWDEAWDVYYDAYHEAWRAWRQKKIAAYERRMWEAKHVVDPHTYNQAA